jgi:cell division protein FtsQ
VGLGAGDRLSGSELIAMAPPAASATARASRSRPRSRTRTLSAQWPPDFRGLARRVLLALAAAAALAAGYLLWLRDSSLVAVERVEIEGLTTSAAEIGGALEREAREMTTLHIDADALEAAVARYPTVKSLSVDRDFPHGLTITVEERTPVAAVDDEGEPLAVDGSGRLLPGVAAADLPAIEAEAPGSARLEGAARAQATVLGAAPGPLRPLIEEAQATDVGVEVTLSSGIELWFGDPDQAAAKWRAAAAVLADPALDALTYIDLRVPERPAVSGDPSAA